MVNWIRIATTNMPSNFNDQSANSIQINSSGVYHAPDQGSLVMDISGGATGKNNIEIGANTYIDGSKCIVIGVDVSASNVGAIAIGESTRSTGRSSLAMNYLTHASGNYSVAMGYDCSAQGMGSFADGSGNTAVGNYAVVLGEQNRAAGISSVAMGNQTDASGNYSVAMGYDCSAQGVGSFADGSGNTAGGDYAVVLGEQNRAAGISSVAMGNQTDASGNYSVAMGEQTYSSGNHSVAMGYDCSAQGVGSFADGSGNTAGGDYSVVLGEQNRATGISSVAMGYQTDASGNYSLALGEQTYSSGNHSVAMGYDCSAQGVGSFADGSGNTAAGNYSVVFGEKCLTTAGATHSMVVGYDCSAQGVGSFVDGSGNTAAGEYSVVMGEGSKAGGHYSTAIGYNCSAHGIACFADGSGCEAHAEYSVSIGEGNDAEGQGSVAMGVQTRANKYSVAMGYNTDASGSASVAMGYNSKTLRGGPSGSVPDQLPTGLSPGDLFQLIYVTSGTATVDSSNITLYNDFVQNTWNSSTIRSDVEDFLGTTITWKCIGSTSTVDAFANVITDPGNANFKGIYKLDGTKVVDTSGALWNSAYVPLLAPVNIDEVGNIVGGGGRVWTGTSPDGHRRPASYQGGLWFGADSGWYNPDQCTYGWMQYVSNSWIAADSTPLTTLLPFYALSEVLTWPEPGASYSVAMGFNTFAQAPCSVAMGSNTIIDQSGSYAVAMGEGTVINSVGGVAMGRYNDTSQNVYFVVGGGTDDSNRNDIFFVDHSGNIDLSGSLYLHSMRNVTNSNQLYYNSTTGEVTYGISGEAALTWAVGTYGIGWPKPDALTDTSGVRIGWDIETTDPASATLDVSGTLRVSLGKGGTMLPIIDVSGNGDVGFFLPAADISRCNTGVRCVDISGDLKVRGVVDPTGLVLSEQDASSNIMASLDPSQTMIWVDTSKNLNLTDGATGINHNLVPAGVIMPFAGPSGNIPGGWLLCDGSSFVSSLYPQLYAALGNTSSLPDLRGRGIYGFSDEIIPSSTSRYDATMGPGGWWQAAATCGTSTIPETALPSHIHNINDPGHFHNTTDPGHTHIQGKGYTADYPSNSNYYGAVFGDFQNETNSSVTGITVNSGTTGIIVTQPGGDGGQYPGAFVCLNFIIRAF